MLAGDDLRASFVPAAGMIGCSLTHRGEELLVQRGGLDAWRGTGRSFGLPLLHPWANRLRDWRYAAGGRAVTIDRARGVVRADDDAARLAATLDYGRRDDRLAVFPFPHCLTLELELAGDALTITTRVEATGGDEVPIAFGWHPWLSLPGVPRAEWELEMPAREGLPLDTLGLPTGERTPCAAVSAPLGDRELDVHSKVAEDVRFALRGGGREIAVEWAGGYTHAQVFAPGNLDVVCLEPMMAPVAALSTGKGLRCAAPGETMTGVFRVRVR